MAASSQRTCSTRASAGSAPSCGPTVPTDVEEARPGVHGAVDGLRERAPGGVGSALPGSAESSRETWRTCVRKTTA